jgi:hypothetical protein
MRPSRGLPQRAPEGGVEMGLTARIGLFAGIGAVFLGAVWLWATRGPSILLDLAFLACL